MPLCQRYGRYIARRRGNTGERQEFRRESRLQLYGSSSDDDCQGYVLSFERFVAATTIRIFHETIVARRPNRIAETRYMSDIALFFIPRFAANGCTTAFVARIVVLVIFAKQHFVIVLGYTDPQCIQALYPEILSDINVLYISNICIYMHTYTYRYIYIFFYKVSSCFTISLNFLSRHIRI